MTANTQAATTPTKAQEIHINRNPIKLLPVESSQIAARGYDPETKTLAIQFKSKVEGKPGTVYHYGGFEQSDWENWQKADSVGSHFYRQIKPNTQKFPFVKIS